MLIYVPECIRTTLICSLLPLALHRESWTLGLLLGFLLFPCLYMVHYLPCLLYNGNNVPNLLGKALWDLQVKNAKIFIAHFY